MLKMLIAFCGVDGSGKTTFANKTVDYLRKEDYSVKLIKPFEYLLLKNYLKTKDSKVILNKKSKPYYYKFWGFLALIDNLLYYLVRIKPLLKKYDFVICDRYFYDFVTSFLYYGFIFKWFAKIYLNILPKPGLLFVLDVTPKLALKREKIDKHSIDFYKEQTKCYKKISQKLGILLDTSKKNIFPDIKKHIKLLNSKS